MPNAVVKIYAKKSGKTVEAVEKIWDEVKAGASKKFKTSDPDYWSYVNGTVKKILGLNESTSFKEFVELSFDNPVDLSQNQVSAAIAPYYVKFIASIFAARDKVHELHLATSSYSQHVALNDLYELLLEFVDELTETFQGKYGIIDLKIPAADDLFTQDCPIIFIKDFTKWLETDGRSLVGSDSFLINIYEELLGEVYRIKYKLDKLS